MWQLKVNSWRNRNCEGWWSHGSCPVSLKGRGLSFPPAAQGRSSHGRCPVNLKGRGLTFPSQPKGTMWQLEARAAGEAAWRVVSTEKADPMVKVGGLAPGTKYTFRSREGAGLAATLRTRGRDGGRPLPRSPSAHGADEVARVIRSDLRIVYAYDRGLPRLTEGCAGAPPGCQYAVDEMPCS